jgi:hypothetical protein
MDYKQQPPMLRTCLKGMVWEHWWHSTDRSDQVDTTHKKKSFPLKKILKCKQQGASPNSDTSALMDKLSKILNQTMSIGQFRMRQGTLKSLGKKIQLDMLCNFPDQTNCIDRVNKASGWWKEDDRMKTQQNTECNLNCQHN